MKKKGTKLLRLENFVAKIKFQATDAEKVYGVRTPAAMMIYLSPFFIVFFIGLFHELSLTHLLVVSIIVENQLLMSSLTSLFLISGGVLSLRLALLIKKQKKGFLMFWFYLLFSVGLLFIGMEKVQWGQLFFISKNQSSLTSINQQEETFFHGIRFWLNYLEIFPLAFGVAGLFGIWKSKIPHLLKINVPRILWSWFVIIAIISAIDLSHDFYDPPPQFDNLINNLEEVIEMMVGISGFLFVWLNTRKFRIGRRDIV